MGFEPPTLTLTKAKRPTLMQHDRRFSLTAAHRIDFSNVNVNGSSLGSFTPTVSNYYEGRKNVITVGPITDGGTAFVTTQGA